MNIYSIMKDILCAFTHLFEYMWVKMCIAFSFLILSDNEYSFIIAFYGLLFIDLVLGIIRSIRKKKFSSKHMRQKVIGKTVAYTLVLIMVNLLVNIHPIFTSFRTFAIGLLAISEAISILENIKTVCYKKLKTDRFIGKLMSVFKEKID